MIIKKIKQVNVKEYEVIGEKGETFLLFDETILKYAILVNKEIAENLIEEIKQHNELMKTYYEILKKLSRKQLSSYEIRKLYKNVEDDDMELLIDKLKKTSLINDELYLKFYISDQIKLSNNGPIIIKNKLKEIGFPTDIIEDEINNIDKNIWIDKIKKISSQKSKINRKYSEKEMKNKLKIYLISLGYYNSQIENNLNIVETNQSLIIEKEYNKLLKKYERKNIEKSNIDNNIKYELKRKGFKHDDIENIFLNK